MIAVDRSAERPPRRERTVGGSAAASGTDYRELSAPGSFWEYNDVRVNRTSLALLERFREPLPDVLRREIMDPISASDTWTWHGYRTSWVEIDGRDIQSVSGGAHWGGGVWISTLDHARFGLLYQNDGLWGDQRILGSDWIAATLEPCELNDNYGLLWWLNTDHGIAARAGPTAYAARGAGGNVIFVDPDRALVIVLRWSSDPRTAIDGIIEAMI